MAATPPAMLSDGTDSASVTVSCPALIDCALTLAADTVVADTVTALTRGADRSVVATNSADRTVVPLMRGALSDWQVSAEQDTAESVALVATRFAALIWVQVTLAASKSVADIEVELIDGASSRVADRSVTDALVADSVASCAVDAAILLHVKSEMLPVVPLTSATVIWSELKLLAIRVVATISGACRWSACTSRAVNESPEIEGAFRVAVAEMLADVNCCDVKLVALSPATEMLVLVIADTLMLRTVAEMTSTL